MVGVNDYYDNQSDQSERTQMHGIDNITPGSSVRYRSQFDFFGGGSWTDMTQIEAVNIQCTNV
jgi:hypothetical protein